MSQNLPITTLPSEVVIEPKDIVQTSIRPEHAKYLLERHKTLDLLPLPSADPADTLNWPAWKKNVNLGLVAFSGAVSTGMTVGVVPAFDVFSKTYHTSINRASYLGTVPLIFLAIAPLIWIPIADRFGRRPVWMLTVLAAGAFNIGCSAVETYGAHLIMRICIAIFVAPGIALGQGVVMESYFAQQRAEKMGIWVLLVNSGVFLGPLIVGFIIDHLGWRWMYRIFALINLLQLVLYSGFGPETLYSGVRMVSLRENNRTTFNRQYLALHRINPAPFRFCDFWEPFLVLRNPKIALATLSYTICFGFVFVMVINEISIVYGSKFHLSPEQSGLNFIGMFIGALLGEFVGGPLSDYTVKHRILRRGSRQTANPEDRLALAQAGFPLVIAGIVVFLVQAADLRPTAWNITPTVGAGIAAFGMEIVSTILITYCSDCYGNHQSAAVGVIINFSRLAWGFLGPFWYPSMFDSCGFHGAAGLVAGLIIVFSIIPVAFLQMYYGRRAQVSNFV